MRVCLLGALCSIPFGLAFPLAATPERAALLLAPSIFFLAMPFGVAPAAIQEIMPNCLRSQASAVYLFLVNLIGLGLGPTAVAWCTDYVFHDDQAVRYGLMLVLPMAASIGSLLLASGLPHYRASIERLKGWSLPAGQPAE